MELRPKEIEIPKENPFEHDLLKRKQYADVLTQIVRNAEDGFTLSINADWGYGKTTFVKMWEAMLQAEGYKTIYFNAWESDFVADPMMALIDGLREGFETKNLPAEKLQLAKAFWKTASKLVQLVPQYRIIGEIAETIQEGIGECTEDNDELQKCTSIKQLVYTFRKQLSDFAKTIDEQKQLIVFVDELDRCRPDYAVQMLERIKHFFAIDNIIFVLSIDKSVLCKSIRAVYGGLNIDTDAYLRRFVDLEFDLPEPDISDFIEEQFKQKGIGIYFTNYQDNLQKHYNGEDREATLRAVLSDCLAETSKSLRDVEKYFNRLGIIFSSKDLSHKYLDVTSYLLYLYMFYRDVYYHLINFDLEIPDMWAMMQQQIDSVIPDAQSDHYRRYMGTAIVSFAAYIDQVDRRGGYKHEFEQKDANLEWFPSDYRDWLKSEISNHMGDILTYLSSHIELLKETFNWETAE